MNLKQNIIVQCQKTEEAGEANSVIKQEYSLMNNRCLHHYFEREYRIKHNDNIEFTIEDLYILLEITNHILKNLWDKDFVYNRFPPHSNYRAEPDDHYYHNVDKLRRTLLNIINDTKQESHNTKRLFYQSKLYM